MNTHKIKVMPLLLVATLFGYQANAQKTSLKVGSNATIKESSAGLQLDASDKGALLPRIALTGTLDVSTIPNLVNGITVYNTATVAGVNAVRPGYYYYNLDTAVVANTKWIRFEDDREILVPPFNIAGGNIKSKSNTDNIYQNANVGLGDFSATPMTAKLDVQGTARLRALTNADLDLANYNTTLVADENGNLGYTTNAPAGNWLFNDAQTAVCTTNTLATASNSKPDILELNLPIVVPANTAMKIIVSYSLPASYQRVPSTVNVNYLGATLLKDEIEVPAGSRKYSAVRPAAASAGSVSGLAINGSAIEEIVNNTASPITIIYRIKGYTEGMSTTALVRFGKFALTTGSNFNWGAGNLSLVSFYKKI